MVKENNRNFLKYEGCNFLRLRLVLSTLSGKAIVIENIRSKEDVVGLREYEGNFISLLDKLTNGSVIVINDTGTRVSYQPGLLQGGEIEHDCNLDRSIGYYLESIIALAPFCKHPIKAVLRGVTNDSVDPSVDSFRHGTMPVLKRFLGAIVEGLELKIVKRGLMPNGGGEVHFSCPIIPKLKTIQLIDPGKIKRIRGVAYATKTSPLMANRVLESAKEAFKNFISDVYIYADHCRGVQGGKSPGFGISLVAETTTGCFYTADISSNKSGSETPSVPEELGTQAAHLLLEEIYRGGCVDSNNQTIATLFMALGQKNVSKLLVGPLSPYTIQFLRHLNDFFQLMFNFDVQPKGDSFNTGADKILLTCVGYGFTNLSKLLK